ncbi:MAG: alpha/beta hydrolase [Gammaproteobacteria bacterium]|nr:alpha/beta hydrolase [Gammaproteobacteria bacterium]
MSDLFDDLRFVKNGPATIAYVVAGPSGDEAPTVCFIASTGRGPEDFNHLCKILVNLGIRIVLPWPRGIGQSTGPTDGVDFHDLASDAAAALDCESGSAGAFVAGHAYGCWIARTIANNYPESIKGVILLAAGAGKWPEYLSRAIDTAMSNEAPEQERLDALRLAFFSEPHDPHPWLDGWSASLASMQRAARARTDKSTWWSSGTAPILDMVGLQDPFRSADDLEFYVSEFGSRVELRLVDGASHALPEEKPDEVAAHMLDWLHRQRQTR